MAIWTRVRASSLSVHIIQALIAQIVNAQTTERIVNAGMNFLDLADKAARCVLGRRPYLWSAEDWQDANHEAVCGILEAHTANEAIAFTAAKHAIYDWLHLWLRHRSAGSIFEYIDFTAPDESISEPLDLEPLRAMLADVRTRKANPDKIDQEIRFLALLRQGYSIEGIGVELGISRRNVYAIRERLLPRLRMIANGDQPKRKEYIVSAASLANLQRTNTDPEARKRRGEAIRTAKALKQALEGE